MLPLFIFFSLPFPFYIRDDQFPKNSDYSIRELTTNFLYEYVLRISSNELIYWKKMNQFPIIYGVIIYSFWTLHFLCMPKVRINTCQSGENKIGKDKITTQLVPQCFRTKKRISKKFCWGGAVPQDMEKGVPALLRAIKVQRYRPFGRSSRVKMQTNLWYIYSLCNMYVR